MTACIAEFKAESNYVTRSFQAYRGAELKSVNPNSLKSETSYSSSFYRASGFSKFFFEIKPLSERKLMVLAAVVNCFLSILGCRLMLNNSPFELAKNQPIVPFEEGRELNGNLSAQNSQSSKSEFESMHSLIDENKAEVGPESPSGDAHSEFVGGIENPINATADYQINNLQEELQAAVFDNTSDEELVDLITKKMCYIQLEELLIPTHCG